MKIDFRKVTAFLLALFIATGMVPMNAAAEESTVTYTRVTSYSGNMSGKYLIVCESAGKAFNGSPDGYGFDAASISKDVVIKDGKIVLDRSADDFYVTITSVNDTTSYVIRTAKGALVYQFDNNFNRGRFDKESAPSTGNALNYVECNSDGSAKITGRSGAILCYDNNSDQQRFLYGGYDLWEPVYLYREEGTEVGGGTMAQVSAPKASVAQGLVFKGTQLMLSCDTDGAVITVDSGNGSSVYTGPITIDTDMTLYVTASKDGMLENVSTFSYVVAKNEYEEISDLEELSGNEVIVISHPSSRKVFLPTEEDIAGDSIISGNKLGASNAGEFSVTKDAQGHYTFMTDDGRYLSCDGTYIHYAGAENESTLFDLEEADSGWYLRSVNCTHDGNASYIVGNEEYYPTFGCNSMDTSNKERYTFAFYKTEKPAFLEDGQLIVIYNHYGMNALSDRYNGNCNMGINVWLENGVLRGYTDAEVWKVGVNDDGTYTFTDKSGKKLSMGETAENTSLDDANTSWIITGANTEDCVCIENTARGINLNWSLSEEVWNYDDGGFWGDPALEQIICKVENYPSEDEPECILKDGDVIAIYYEAYGEYPITLGMPDDGNISLSAASASIIGGYADLGNRALVFTVHLDPEGALSFETGGRYLATNTAAEIFLSDTNVEGTKWMLIENADGYRIQSTEMICNASPVELKLSDASFCNRVLRDYYADYCHFDGGTFAVDYADKFRFCFYPVDLDKIETVDDVVNRPSVLVGAEYIMPGNEYRFPVDLDHIFPITELSCELNGISCILEEEGPDLYVITIPPDLKPDLATICVWCKDDRGVEFSEQIPVPVLDYPGIGERTPSENAQTGDDKKPVIGFTLFNAGDDPQVEMTVNGSTVIPTVDGNVYTYVPENPMDDGPVDVHVYVVRADRQNNSGDWMFYIGNKYSFTEGMDTEWIRGQREDPMIFEINGPFDGFEGIEIDGEEIDPNNYQILFYEGIISLPKELVESLADGKHTIRAIFNDGDCTAAFNIKGSTDVPPTGYRSFMSLYITIAVLAVVIFVITLKRGRVYTE